MSDTPLHIAHVVETLERGGLERMVCDLAMEQARAGWQVSVHCVFHRGLLADELAAAGVEVTTAGKRSGADLRALWRLRRALQRAAPEVIHTHNATAHYHAVAACRATRLRPLLNTRHGMGDAAGSRVEQRYRAALKGTAAVVTVARHAAEHYVRAGIVSQRRVTVIPNGIRIERFLRASRESARAALGVDAGALLVGTVGRLNWAKDQAILVQAIAALWPRYRGLCCVIVGEGALRGELQSLIDSLGLAASVRLLGDRDDVPALLPAFDVFALPSRTEGYSLALLEAAASALPAVATDVGGNREIIQPGETGVIATGGFAAALDDVLADGEARRRMGEGARRWAEANASIEAMTLRYEALYRRLLAGSPP